VGGVAGGGAVHLVRDLGGGANLPGHDFDAGEAASAAGFGSVGGEGVESVIKQAWVFFVIGVAAGQQAPTGNVVGQIVDAYVGEGQKATVEIGGLRVNTDLTGHFRIDNVPYGSQTLVASVPGFKMAKLVIRVEIGKTIELPPLPIQIAGGCTNSWAEIKYLDSNTGALSGIVRVGIDRAVADVVLKKGTTTVATTRANRDGEFRFAPVVPGDYAIEVRRVGMYDEVVAGLLVRRGYESAYPDEFRLQACPNGNCAVPRPKILRICE
jgi:hypothetical protein